MTTLDYLERINSVDQQSLLETKLFLEKCLDNDFHDFLLEIADLENISYQEVLNRTKVLLEKLIKFSQLLIEIKKVTKNKYSNLVLVFDLADDIVSNYWFYIPIEIKNKLKLKNIVDVNKKYNKNIKKNSKLLKANLTLIKIVIGSSIESIKQGKQPFFLLIKLVKSFSNFIDSLEDQIREDLETLEDIKAIEAFHESLAKGEEELIPWEDALKELERLNNG